MKPVRDTVGFGCPTGVDPHHVCVEIPKGKSAPVQVIEKFGIRAGTDGLPEELLRVELERQKWAAIADELKRVFNERLKAKKLPVSRWVIGENRLDRLLGKELCVLAWAVEKADLEVIPVALKNWVGLKPEERWWLFTATAAATGGADDSGIGWRKALRFALTENPVKNSLPRARVRKPSQRELIPKPLPLFDR